MIHRLTCFYESWEQEWTRCHLRSTQLHIWPILDIGSHNTLKTHHVGHSNVKSALINTACPSLDLNRRAQPSSINRASLLCFCLAFKRRALDSIQHLAPYLVHLRFKRPVDVLDTGDFNAEIHQFSPFRSNTARRTQANSARECCVVSTYE